jgi:hypothetical protein
MPFCASRADVRPSVTLATLAGSLEMVVNAASCAARTATSILPTNVMGSVTTRMHASERRSGPSVVDTQRSASPTTLRTALSLNVTSGASERRVPESVGLCTSQRGRDDRDPSARERAAQEVQRSPYERTGTAVVILVYVQQGNPQKRHEASAPRLDSRRNWAGRAARRASARRSCCDR